MLWARGTSVTVISSYSMQRELLLFSYPLWMGNEFDEKQPVKSLSSSMIMCTMELCLYHAYSSARHTVGTQ